MSLLVIRCSTGSQAQVLFWSWSLRLFKFTQILDIPAVFVVSALMSIGQQEVDDFAMLDEINPAPGPVINSQISDTMITAGLTSPAQAKDKRQMRLSMQERVTCSRNSQTIWRGPQFAGSESLFAVFHENMNAEIKLERLVNSNI